MSEDRIKSRFVDIGNDQELHYLEKGQGRPLIFIPGLTFAGEIFEHQLEHFSKNYRVIAMDPRGQGLSVKLPDGNDFMTHGRDLAALIDRLELEKPVLIGWSSGNLDVWSYLQQSGYDNVAGAVFIDMSPLPLSPDPAWWTEGTIEDLSAVATQMMTTSKGNRDFFSDYAKSEMIQHEMTEAELEYLMDISAKTPHWISKQLFTDAIHSNFLETAKEAPHHIPTFMFIAEHWQDVAEPFYHKQVPETPTYVMGGHLMFYEYPDRWNGVLEDFLAKLD
ncbi:MAG: alpha/beta fold hydrolase [Eubacteriaceae bacterium]|jgi:non-heme chloroperoxidase